jgi:hypothetical protein
MVDVVMENDSIILSHEYKSMPLKKFNRRVKRENVLNVDEQNQNENMRSHQSTKSSTV